MTGRGNGSRTPAVVILVVVLCVSVVALLGVGILLIRSATDDSTREQSAVVPSAASDSQTPTTTATLTEIEIVQQSIRSVVHVRTDRSTGTGFIYEIAGVDTYVVTNAHVIGNAQQVTVVSSNGTEHVADIWMMDEMLDLAMLRVGGLTEITPLPRGDANQLELGTPVYVIGYALGSNLLGDPSISRGIVSGRRLIGEVEYVQTDAAMNPGNSGGPVINVSGEVVGIATMGIRDVNGQPIEGINFAIPINAVGSIPDSPQTGSSESPVIVPTREPVTRPDIDPIPTPTLRPAPTATPRPSSENRNTTLVDADDFTGGTNGSLLVLPADAHLFAVRNGMLSVSLPAGDEEYFLAYSPISDGLRDGTVTARIALDGTDSGGVMGRAKLDNDGNLINAYACLIRSAPNARGFGCYRRNNYEWTMLASQDSDAIIPGAWNDVELRIVSGGIEFIVNGQRIFSWRDTDPLEGGRWGAYLRRYDGSGGSSISYDFIRIYQYQ